MENKETEELKLIPEDKFLEILEYKIKEVDVYESICPKCESFISTKHYPYAYDTENNDVVYVSRCPNCGEILYSRD